LLKKIIKLEELNINEKDDSGWVGMTWAIVNGHKDIVKIILHSRVKLGGTKIMEILNADKKEEKQDIANDTLFETPLQDIFKKPINPLTFGKYSPLHWAAYKGNCIISSLLFKNSDKKPVEMSLDIDMLGNTALHQAAASNNFDVNYSFLLLKVVCIVYGTGFRLRS